MARFDKKQIEKLTPEQRLNYLANNLDWTNLFEDEPQGTGILGWIPVFNFLILLVMLFKVLRLK